MIVFTLLKIIILNRQVYNVTDDYQKESLELICITLLPIDFLLIKKCFQKIQRAKNRR